ncbi:MAG: aldehyde dehydrogenase family protein [Candidatus Aminicenantes bacterium]|nr:aldehyde dehydrogenase family protein [Candidatus Aminicenantes bacterium]
MSFQPVLIDGTWQQANSPVGSFSAVNPSTKTPLADLYPVSSFADIEIALFAAHRINVEVHQIPADTLAHFLETFAHNIEAKIEALVEMASLETALPKESRLRASELPRTINQLRDAAATASDLSWCRAIIDTKTNIRSKYSPLGGPVAVFGPNNFPFAFNSVAGGDFAAAIAAGNPVIAKANPGHPGTTKIFAEAAFEAVQSSGLPKAMVQLLYHFQPEDGLKLVTHPLVGATAFTGSRAAGLHLKEAADRAGKPIYLEMSSVNPVFILPGALEERSDVIANEFFHSCTLGAGQFCTNPGLVILPQEESGEAFLQSVSKFFQSSPAGFLLSEKVLTEIVASVEGKKKHGAEIVTGGREINGPGYSFANTLLRVSGDVFQEHPKTLQTEAFGPASLFVFARDKAQMQQIAKHVEGSLTGSIYSHSQGQDDPLYKKIEPILRIKVGRLLNDKMPTGVAVTPAMNHGGPYPATGHPGFTAVGIPASLLRFTALHCYDNVHQHRLPEELRDKNPTGFMWRFIDGEWTQKDV